MRKLDSTDLRIAASLQERERRRKEFYRLASESHERRLEIEENAEEAFIDLWAAALATTTDIEAFTTRLDHLDEATIKALQENQIKLDKVEARLDAMLDRAYVHNDGRRLFKTRDGSAVYDEFGKKLSSNDIVPDEISNDHPFWEDFKADTDHKRNLIQERKNILKFQKKLDKAREKTDEGGLTNGELDELEKDLESSMPLSVRKHLPNRGIEKTAPSTPDLKQPFNLNSADLDMPDIGKLDISGPRQRL